MQYKLQEDINKNSNVKKSKDVFLSYISVFLNTIHYSNIKATSVTIGGYSQTQVFS